MHLRYCIYTAAANQKKGHAQVVMKNLGIDWQHSTPQSMYDQWWFWNCENLPTPLPPYLKPLDLDPMRCVGRGLTEKQAESIRDHVDYISPSVVKEILGDRKHRAKMSPAEFKRRTQRIAAHLIRVSRVVDILALCVCHYAGLEAELNGDEFVYWSAVAVAVWRSLALIISFWTVKPAEVKK